MARITVSRALRGRIRRGSARFVKKRFKSRGYIGRRLLRDRKAVLPFAGAALFVVLLIVIFAALFGDGGGYEDDLSELKIPYGNVEMILSLSERFGLPFDELLTLYLADNMFFPVRDSERDEKTVERRLILGYNELREKYAAEFAPFREAIGLALSEIKAFPVDSEQGGYIYGDGFSVERGRAHRGTDIYDRDSLPGRLTVLSASDGYVLRAGENRDDGRFVIIRTDAGSELCYLHLDAIRSGVSEGARISAGQEIGTVGNSGIGCGAEGSVSLHMGYMQDTEEWGELWLNPYIFIRLLDETQTGDTYGENKLG